MQYSKKHFSGIVFFSRHVFIMTLFVYVLTCTSCNPAIKFASVQYDATAVTRFLDSSRTNYFTPQFNSPDGRSNKNPFDLISYARTSNGGFVDIPAYNLIAVEKIKPKHLQGKCCWQFRLTQ